MIALDDKGKCIMSRIGYAAGAYDLFHVGHLDLLRQAKDDCDYLIAGVVSDEMLKLNKGITPVVPLVERLEVVRNIRFVDRAVAEVRPSKLETWKELRFDVFFKGSDWQGTEKGRALEREFAAVGVEVVYFPYCATTSSTALRCALSNLAHLATRSPRRTILMRNRASTKQNRLQRPLTTGR
jgi:glycerol-3-phosphate cytidylyltransferase